MSKQKIATQKGRLFGAVCSVCGKQHRKTDQKDNNQLLFKAGSKVYEAS
jgi:hypothetical protein